MRGTSRTPEPDLIVLRQANEGVTARNLEGHGGQQEISGRSIWRTLGGARQLPGESVDDTGNWKVHPFPRLPLLFNISAHAGRMSCAPSSSHPSRRVLHQRTFDMPG
jgi:hypothetical protein